MLLLFMVSVMAMLLHIRAVFLSAILSALIWDYFFIPPVFTFSVGSTDDKLMVLMYFVVALVNAAFTNKLKKMEESNRDKQEKEKSIKLYNTLLNSLSHELRTPIATIIASTDNLQDKKVNEGQRQELLHQIMESSFRLNRQVENLLNMSRLDSGTLQLKRDWCDMNELVYTCVDQMKDLGERHFTQINIQDNFPLCKLDRGIMQQVICNLLQNAYAYVPQSKKVIVSINRKDEDLFIQLEDEGNGFPESEIDKVFDKFYRLKDSGSGGTGLGLSIVKGYVEAHNGLIRLENKLTGGAKFTIQINCETQYYQNLSHD